MIVTLAGDNYFLINKEIRKRVDDFITKYGDIGVQKIYGDEVEYQIIYDSLTTVPFLSEKKLVVIYEASSNKEFSEKASSLIGLLGKETDVIFVEYKIDKRSSFYKLLKSQTDYLDFHQLDDNALISWIIAQAKEEGANLSRLDADYLIDRIGANQQLLASELSKILLFNKTITREIIDLTTDANVQSTIFELLDAVFSGDRQRAQVLYLERRALKDEPQKIIAMLAWQLQILALLLTSKSISPSQIAKDSKISPYVITKANNIISKISFADIRRMTHELLVLDIRLKSESIDADDALELYILGINKTPSRRFSNTR